MRPAALRAARTSRDLSPLLTALLVVGAGLLSAATAVGLQAHAIVVAGLIALLAGLALAIINPVAMIFVGILAVPLEGILPVHRTSIGILALASLGWLIRWLTSFPVTLPRQPILKAFAAYVAANCVGLIFAPEPLIVLRQVATFTIMLLVAVCLVQGARQRLSRRLLFTLAVCGGLTGVVAIVHPDGLTSPVFGAGDVTRATGGLGSPNALGMLLAMLIPVQLVFALRGSFVERVVGAGCAGLALSGMGLAVSRGAFVGLAVAIVVLTGWAPFRRAALVLLVVVAALGLAGKNPASYAGSKVVERLTETSSTASTDPRVALWRVTPNMIRDHPIFGVGALEFGHYIPAYGVLTPAGPAGVHAHNLELTILAETGVVGLLAFLALLLAVAAGVRQVITRGPPASVGFAWALAASFCGFVANGVVDYALPAAPIAAVFFVLVATVAVLRREASMSPAT